MDDTRLDRLPEQYREALLLRRAGEDDVGIATALELERQAVKTLLQLAEAKLASQDDPDDGLDA